jgi:hypothetical protein
VLTDGKIHTTVHWVCNLHNMPLVKCLKELKILLVGNTLGTLSLIIKGCKNVNSKKILKVRRKV